MKNQLFSITLSFLFTLLVPLHAFAQSGGIKFGKIDKQYLEMDAYEHDTSASAVILSDYGTSYFKYNQTQDQFQQYFQRHRRIKIFNSQGYKWADHDIPVYHKGGNKEVVSSLKAVTYNLVNGKIEKHKLEKDDIFEEKYSDNWDLKKFTMPNVTEGSVIEYTYTITSDFIFNLRTWQFQSSIPVMWSEYKTSIPEYYQYKKLQQGYIPLVIAENKREGGSINFTSKSSTGGLESNQVNYTNYIDRLAAKNVPAMIPEAYMTTVDDYISQIDFELATINMPNRLVESIMDTWETMNKKLLENLRFGDQINRKAFIKEQAAVIAANHADPESKIKAAVSHVKDKMTWNGSYRTYSNGNIKKSYESGTGSSADINLTLIALLRGLGLQADPVVLSTRSHGRAPLYPIITKFNHVIARVPVGDKFYMLDATDKLLPFNQLPFECLNGQGRLISKAGTDWVDLKNTENSSDFTMVAIKLNEENEFMADIQSSWTGYDAHTIREKIKKSGKESYIKSKIKDHKGLTADTFTITNIKENDRAITEKYEVNLSEYLINSANVIYVDPMLFFELESNPLKADQRHYPVDFGCPMASAYRLTIPIPEGYNLEEAPESVLISLPNNGGKFRYAVSKSGSLLTVSTSYNIKQTMFLPEEYATLKQFFNLIVAKHAEKIVLKKHT